MKKTTTRALKNLIGPTVRELRLAQRKVVSQQDLAGRLAALGIRMERSGIAKIEKGRRYVLDYEALAIAKAFRVPIERLFPKRRG